MKYFTLLHFVTDSIFSQISRLNFDYCSCLDIFYYPTFLIHQNFRMDLRYMGVHPKMKHLVWNHQKNGWRGRNTIFRLCDLNETLIFMSKNRLDYCPQMSFCFVSQREEGYSLSYDVPKIWKLWKKLTNELSKFMFQNGLKSKTYIFGTFWRQTAQL